MDDTENHDSSRNKDNNMEEEEDAPVFVRFVIPSGKTEITVSEDLSTAFERSSEAGLSPVWIKEPQVGKLNPTKMDVFVIDPFSGPAFDKVTNSSKYKCTVVGPRCLLSCLKSNTPVPELNYPMYTAAMKGLVVTCSGLDKPEKDRLRFLIERMAGIYSNSFHDGITHLVTSTVKSQKYEVAVGKETPVMTKEWVEDVWKVSCKDYVAAIDPRFSTHRCPALLGVTVSVSQLNKADKELLRKSIETHGGTYSGVLEMDKTTVLVCASPSGDKYQHAKKWNIPCLTSDWVFDGIDKGYCLGYEGYRVERHKANASSPIKNTSREASLAEVSMCSTIMDPNETNVVTKVNDTVNSTVLGPNQTLLGPSLSSVLRGKTTAQWMQDLDLARVKKAGTFLDGCKIYLSGFTDHDQEQLRRVLKFAGATRLTQLVESVTHVVHAVSTLPSPDTSRLMTELDLSPHNVAIEWLVESMKRGKPVPESDYPFPPPADNAVNFLPPPAAVEQQAETQFEAALLAQYGSKGAGNAGNATQGQENGDATSCTVDGTNTMSQVQQFLTGSTLELVGFNEDTQSYLTDWVTEAGGELVYTDFQGELDYLVTPCTGGTSRHKYKQHVSSIWLEDCLDQGELLDILYFHKIINIDKELKPIDGVVTGLSGYTGREREFLNSLVESLGGLPQEIFAKRDNKDKGARGSTHLICPEGAGQKYTAALKWKLPVINCDWLVACLREKQWVSEAPFLVGDSTAVTPGKPMPVEVTDATVVEDNTVMEQDDTVVDEVSRRISVGEISFPRESKREELRRKSLDKSADLTKVEGDVSRFSEVDETRKLDLSNGPETPVTNASKISRMLDTPGAALDTPTLERLRPQPLNLDISVTPQRWADSQPSPSQVAKRKRDSEGDGLDKMDTPKTPYGAHWTPNPSPRTRKFYKRRVDNMPDLQLTELEKQQADRWANQPREDYPYYKKKAEDKLYWEGVRDKHLDPVKNKEEHEKFLDGLEAKGIPVIGRDPRSFDEIMEEKYKKQGKSWKTMAEDVSKRARMEVEDDEEGGEGCKVLEGVVIYVAKKLQATAGEMHMVVESLGGKFQWKYDQEVTHFVFQGKNNDLTKEFRIAKEEDKFVVHPDWVNMCRDEKSRVQEEAFPHSFNPRMKLDISSTQNMSQTLGNRRNSSMRGSRGGLKKKSPEANAEQSRLEVLHEKEKEKEEESQKRRSAEINRDLARMEELMESVSRTPADPVPRKVMKTTLTSVDLSDRLASVEKDKDDKEEEIEVDKESQILWVDPQEAVERAKLQEQLNAETQDLANNMDTMETFGSMNMPDDIIPMTQDDDKENNKNEVVAKKEKPKVFMASGWSDESVSKAVEKLGGKVSTLGQYDSAATHMLAVKVSRSEKMLGSVAAGKWVLHPDYVTSSLAAGRWLAEEQYEWGNPEMQYLENSSSTEVKLAKAARKWRVANSDGADAGAFSGIQAILHMPLQKKGPFSRLIESGGGTVLDVKAPYSGPSTATHCFTEPKFLTTPGQVDLAGMAGRGIPVMQPIFLNDFLTKEEPVKVEDYLLEDFKAVWESKKRSRITTDTPTNALKKSKSVFGQVN